jgi:hypothetical protein
VAGASPAPALRQGAGRLIGPLNPAAIRPRAADLMAMLPADRGAALSPEQAAALLDALHPVEAAIAALRADPAPTTPGQPPANDE